MEEKSGLKKKTPRVLILLETGIASIKSLKLAFELARFEVVCERLDDLLAFSVTMEDLCQKYAVICIPGGASFLDALGAGKMFALKLRRCLQLDLELFCSRGGLVLGIGNGFQVLMRLGVFGKDISFDFNTSGHFLYRWVKVTPVGTRCVWLKGLGSLELPIAHEQGKVLFSVSRKLEVLEKMERMGALCLKYEHNPNGSQNDIAGLCDVTGRILGLMPHPESFIQWVYHPEWTISAARAGSPGPALALFENAYNMVNI